MNEPIDNGEVRDDRIDRWKALRPRAPKLDWDAIHSARITEAPMLPQAGPAPFQWRARMTPAIAWWSGLAAGAVITFFAMQWIVLNDLRKQLRELELTARSTTPKSTEIQTAKDRVTSPSASVVDIHSLLDRTRLSVGSYRGRGDRWIHASSNSDELHSTDTGYRTSGPLEIDRPEPSANRLLLLRELKQIVH
jgi:hypothetical protein